MTTFSVLQGKGIGMRSVFVLVVLVALSASASAAPCTYVRWNEYRGAKLLRIEDGDAYIFATNTVKVDADGAPNAYHPEDVDLHCTSGTGFKGLDCPANAGYPNSSWWRSALVPDPVNLARAYVQPAGNEFAGFFVSKTTLEDSSKRVTDPMRYVDSRTVPYLVFPGQFHQMIGTGTTGDLGYAINLENGKRSPFVVAEIGPSEAELGEMSIALATALGGTNPNPRTGAGVPTGKIVFVIFPKSGRTHRWPLTGEEMATYTDELLSASDGVEGLRACANDV